MIKIDQRKLDRDIRDLVRSAERFSAATGRDQKDAVIKAGYEFSRSAASRAKLGKKNRQVIRNPDWQKGKRNQTISPYLIVKYRQNGGIDLLPKYQRKLGNDPRVKILRRGLAKASFKWMGRKVRGRGSVGKRVRGATTSSYVKRQFKTFEHRLTLGNRLTYVQDAFPGIVQDALQAARRSLDGQLSRKLDRNIRRHFA